MTSVFLRFSSWLLIIICVLFAHSDPVNAQTRTTCRSSTDISHRFIGIDLFGIYRSAEIVELLLDNHLSTESIWKKALTDICNRVDSKLNPKSSCNCSSNMITEDDVTFALDRFIEAWNENENLQNDDLRLDESFLGISRRIRQYIDGDNSNIELFADKELNCDMVEVKGALCDVAYLAPREFTRSINNLYTNATLFPFPELIRSISQDFYIKIAAGDLCDACAYRAILLKRAEDATQCVLESLRDYKGPFAPFSAHKNDCAVSSCAWEEVNHWIEEHGDNWIENGYCRSLDLKAKFPCNSESELSSCPTQN